MDDLKNYFCWNEDCPKYRVPGGDNIRLRDRYGKNNTRLLYCRLCKKKFSERRGTIFFDARLPEKTVVSILEHIIGGCGIRRTGRLLQVDKDTVANYFKRTHQHDETVPYSPAHLDCQR